MTELIVRPATLTTPEIAVKAVGGAETPVVLKPQPSFFSQALQRIVGAGVALLATYAQNKAGVVLDGTAQISITVAVYGVAHKAIAYVLERVAGKKLTIGF